MNESDKAIMDSIKEWNYEVNDLAVYAVNLAANMVAYPQSVTVTDVDELVEWARNLGLQGLVE